MSAFVVELQDETGGARSLLPSLEAVAVATLRHQGVPGGAALTILLSDDERLRALNSQFRGYDESTDVLSFPSGEPLSPEDEGYLGDIAISLPQARRQAESGGHTVLEELQLLIAHGVLHLLGHDHHERSDKARMWAAQTEILQAVGSGLTAPRLPDELSP